MFRCTHTLQDSLLEQAEPVEDSYFLYRFKWCDCCNSLRAILCHPWRSGAVVSPLLQNGGIVRTPMEKAGDHATPTGKACVGMQEMHRKYLRFARRNL